MSYTLYYTAYSANKRVSVNTIGRIYINAKYSNITIPALTIVVEDIDDPSVNIAPIYNYKDE